MSLYCKTENCDLVFPIIDTESIGNSLSSINLNFNALDYELCSIENRDDTTWNPAFTIFSENSAAWVNAFNIVKTNSACWIDTTSTVFETSGFWLKPISIVYPYPFPTSTDIAVVRAWVEDNFPILVGTCYNYIVGQELYVYCPEYTSINRQSAASKTGGTGNKTVRFTYKCKCIGKTTTGVATQTVNCGTVALDLKVNVPDSFINKFVGIKFTVTDSYIWDSGVKIFE